MDPPGQPPDDRPARRAPRAARRGEILEAAHRLRGAVAVVVGRAQLLARRVRAGDGVPPGEVLAGLGAIERAAKGMVEPIAALEADEAPPDPGDAARRGEPPAAEADGREGDGGRVGG